MIDTESGCQNILVVHHDPLLCTGLVTALRQHAGFEVAVAEDAESATDEANRFDAVVADYNQALRLAVSSADPMRQRRPGPRILALTANEGEADIRRALEAGVDGYLLVGGSLVELIEGVTAVAGGARYLCRSVAQRMAESLTRASLTARELEVLPLLVDGESNKAIARQLQIEVGTVKSHVSAIMAKLDATSRTQAAGIAMTRGLVNVRAAVPPARPVLRCGRMERITQCA